MTKLWSYWRKWKNNLYYFFKTTHKTACRQFFQMTFVESEVMECKSGDGEQQVEEVFYNTGEDGQTIVVPGTSNYQEIVGDNKNSVRLVQIRIPASSSGDARSWLSLVQNT